MQTRAFSWHTLYLRWAGLFSACLGLLSAALLLISFREDASNIKLIEAISGICGILLSNFIGKDILDQVRNREESVGLITNTQARLAFVGTRFTFILAGLIGLLLLGTIVFFSVSTFDRINLVCSAPNMKDWMRCAHDLFGLIFA
jgi:hypothetical protein